MRREWLWSQSTPLVPLVFAFFAIGALIKGLLLLREQSGRWNAVTASLSVCLVVPSFAFMVFTADTWARWFSGLCAYGIIKIILALLVGQTTSSGHVKIPAPRGCISWNFHSICLSGIPFLYCETAEDIRERGPYVECHDNIVYYTTGA
jgi:hypothetical protein